LLAVDLGVFHRKAHTVGPREAALWSAVWITLAAVFALGIYHLHGQALVYKEITSPALRAWPLGLDFAGILADN
jgi:tellurite resistance protein TerC